MFIRPEARRASLIFLFGDRSENASQVISPFQEFESQADLQERCSKRTESALRRDNGQVYFPFHSCASKSSRLCSASLFGRGGLSQERLLQHNRFACAVSACKSERKGG